MKLTERVNETFLLQNNLSIIRPETIVGGAIVPSEVFLIEISDDQTRLDTVQSGHLVDLKYIVLILSNFLALCYTVGLNECRP